MRLQHVLVHDSVLRRSPAVHALCRLRIHREFGATATVAAAAGSQEELLALVRAGLAAAAEQPRVRALVAFNAFLWLRPAAPAEVLEELLVTAAGAAARDDADNAELTLLHQCCKWLAEVGSSKRAAPWIDRCVAHLLAQCQSLDCEEHWEALGWLLWSVYLGLRDPFEGQSGWFALDRAAAGDARVATCAFLYYAWRHCKAMAGSDGSAFRCVMFSAGGLQAGTAGDEPKTKRARSDGAHTGQVPGSGGLRHLQLALTKRGELEAGAGVHAALAQYGADRWPWVQLVLFDLAVVCNDRAAFDGARGGMEQMLAAASPDRAFLSALVGFARGSVPGALVKTLRTRQQLIDCVMMIRADEIERARVALIEFVLELPAPREQQVSEWHEYFATPEGQQLSATDSVLIGMPLADHFLYLYAVMCLITCYTRLGDGWAALILSQTAWPVFSKRCDALLAAHADVAPGALSVSLEHLAVAELIERVAAMLKEHRGAVPVHRGGANVRMPVPLGDEHAIRRQDVVTRMRACADRVHPPSLFLSVEQERVGKGKKRAVA